MLNDITMKKLDQSQTDKWKGNLIKKSIVGRYEI